MGVIRNPEKISYMLDTKFINFREFQILGGAGDERGRPEWGWIRTTRCRSFFQNICPNKRFYREKIDFTSFARKRHIPPVL